MKNHPCWIVVADGSRARILARKTPRGDLTLVESLDNPVSRQKTREILTDSPGPEGTSDPLSLPGELEEDRFARRLAQRLSDGAHRNLFKGLVLIAAPRFLGVLRSELPRPVSARVLTELAKNFTALSIEEIRHGLVHQPV
jgi:protein required for attachment to host cells